MIRILNAKQRNLNLILYVIRAYLKDFILFFYFLGFFFFLESLTSTKSLSILFY